MDDKAAAYSEKRTKVLSNALNGGAELKEKTAEQEFFETFLKGELERAFKAGVAEATTIRSPHELDEKPAQRT